MDTFGQRLREERERLGLNQVAFGEIVGVKKNAQVNYEADRRSPDGNYLMLAAEAGVDVLYILTGERDPRLWSTTFARDEAIRALTGFPPPPAHVEQAGDFVPIPVHEASLAAGDGAHNEDEAVIAHLAFRRGWLNRIGVSPVAAAIARARGDSMLPTLHDGDIVLIDRAQASPPTRIRDPNDTRPAPIYALLDDGAARIKRLELATPGTLALLSDNPISPPEFRPVSVVSIIGRVMWWGHTVRE